MKQDNFQKLISNLSLTTIQPTKVEYERLGNPPAENSNIKINWKMIYPKDESFKIENNILQLAPMFEISFECNNQLLFSYKSIFIVLLSIKDKNSFESLWNDEEIQKIFKEKQIRNTLWPIVRQHVLDAMSRLALPSIPLPWLLLND